MPPGDNSNPGSKIEEPPEKSEETISKGKYEPYVAQCSKDDWFVERILDFNVIDSDYDEVYKAVGYWKEISDELRRNNFPLVEGLKNTQNFSQELIDKNRMLHDFLDLLITNRTIHQTEFYEKLRMLLAQGKPYEVFKEKMKRLDLSPKCNEIWENNDVAYRCNTCALTPCMSLCEACFDENGHKGHDFTRFFSREGGACDCGNEDVIKPQGFCKRHGTRVDKPPTDFLDVSLPEFVMVKLLVQLFLQWRGWQIKAYKARVEYHDRYAESQIPFDLIGFVDGNVSKVSELLAFFKECVDYGGPMREAFARLLLDKELYTSLTERTGDDVSENNRIDINLDWRSRILFEEDRKSIVINENGAEYFPSVNTYDKVKCENLLDELIFWIIRQHFPQALINFGLSMFSETDYRDAFSKRFFTWYPCIGKVIRDMCVFQTASRDHDNVQLACSRMIHVSVQMLSSGVLCKKLDEECDLVSTVINLAMYLLCEKTEQSFLSLDPESRLNMMKSTLYLLNRNKPWRVMKIADNPSISNHGYWFVMGDMQNLLSHPNLAISSILNEKTFNKAYIRMLSRMQGMNQVWRVVSGEHKENDSSDDVQRSYTLEFETLAVTLFNMVAAVQSEKHLEAAVTFFNNIYATIKTWFQAMLPGGLSYGIDTLNQCQTFTVSFHIPLHRHISTALSHFHDIPGFQEHLKNTILEDVREMQLLILHPLRIQAARAEIGCGMWARNGNEARYLSAIYNQWSVNNAFQTPDLDLIRFCASQVEKNWMIDTLMANFYLDEIIEVGGGDFNKEDYPSHSEIIEQAIFNYRGEGNDDSELGQNVFSAEKVGKTVKISLENNSPAKSVSYKAENYASSSRSMSQYRSVLEAISEHLEDEETPMPSGLIEQSRLFEKELAEKLAIITRKEWIDPMFHGLFKLIAEMVVVRVNCGASVQEHYRAEMINCLATYEMPHSRLRGCIPDKGSRGSDVNDRMFDEILAQIANFMDPENHVTTTSMQQGVYQLKAEIWENEICPVFCMMRANGSTSLSQIFQKLANKDRVKVESGDGSMKNETSFWIPFLLIDYDKNLRHEEILNIFPILITDKLMLTCITALHLENSSEVGMNLTTIQQAVYLLTLGVDYVRKFDGDEEDKERIIRTYHIPFKLSEENKKETTHTICSFMLEKFEEEARKIGNYHIVLKQILDGVFDSKRVYGGATVYYARFLTILAKVSSGCREAVQCRIKREEDEQKRLLEVAEQEEKLKNLTASTAKDLARKRMQSIMEQRKKKDKEIMEKMMEQEQITKADFDEISTAQPNVVLYDCPICGDSESPNTLKQPFGMLCKMSTNFIAEEQIDSRLENIKELLTIDSEHAKTEEREIPVQFQTRRYFLSSRQLRFDSRKNSSVSFFEPKTGMDLKTCGHFAHIECFNAYRQSLHETRGRNVEGREVGCPMCRFTVNGILPLKLDHGYESKSIGQIKNISALQKCMEKCVEFKEEISPENREARTKLYAVGERSGGALSEIIWSRRRTSDITEMKYFDEAATPSTVLLTLAKANVERNTILRKMGIGERRKNTRRLTTGHLLASAVAVSTAEDRKITLGVIEDLLYPPQFPDKWGRFLESPSEEEKSIDWSTYNYPPMNFECDAPLLKFDPKVMFVRVVSFIRESANTTNEDQLFLVSKMLKMFIQWVAVRGTIRLLFRFGCLTLESISQTPNAFPELNNILECLPQAVLSILITMPDVRESFGQLLFDELTIKEFVESLNQYVEEFLAFSLELLFHLDFITGDVLQKCLEARRVEEAGKILNFGFDLTSLNLDKMEKWLLDFNYNTPLKLKMNRFPNDFREPLTWKPRRILTLPSDYDLIFNRYYHRECENCNKIPPHPLVCLFCSKLVCLNDCCGSNIRTVGGSVHVAPEIEAHAEECCSSSGVFLSLKSSLIIITRARQSAIWGSIYLDAYGEEDRNLRRGKPLQLSMKRFEFLQADYAEQEWQRVRQWVPNSNNSLLNHIEDSHYYQS